MGADLLYDIDYVLSRTVEDENGCWIWKGRCNSVGRGIFTVERMIDGKRKVTTFQAHHEIYRHHKGDFNARYLDHSCGNFRCCNPDHLLPRTFRARFWDNIEKPNGNNGCWIWQGWVRPNGYGSITVDGISHMPHRLAYQLKYGEIPEGLMVLHSCNNRLCMNPTHLRIGYHQDNMDDMTRADRQAKGSRNGAAKLTEDEVFEIKALLRRNVHTYKEIGDMYGMSRSAIKDIKTGRTW